jgi:hypothetical protein
MKASVMARLMLKLVMTASVPDLPFTSIQPGYSFSSHDQASGCQMGSTPMLAPRAPALGDDPEAGVVGHEEAHRAAGPPMERRTIQLAGRSRPKEKPLPPPVCWMSTASRMVPKIEDATLAQVVVDGQHEAGRQLLERGAGARPGRAVEPISMAQFKSKSICGARRAARVWNSILPSTRISLLW